MRFNAQGHMAEHWEVVQQLPEPYYDPMRPSAKNLTRLSELFEIG